jgi:hypothetical protein
MLRRVREKYPDVRTYRADIALLGTQPECFGQAGGSWSAILKDGLLSISFG